MRSAKLSEIVDTHALNRNPRNWATPTSGLVARGRQMIFFKVHFLVNGWRYRHRSFAVRCPSSVSRKTPEQTGVTAPPWGSDPPPQILLDITLRFLGVSDIFINIPSARTIGPLPSGIIFGNFHLRNFEKNGVKFFGGVALLQNPPLVAPLCGRRILHIFTPVGL